MAQPTPEWGAIYTPTSVGPAVAPRTSPLSEATLDQLGVRYIRYTWVDWTNTTRYHVFSRSYFRRLLSSARPGFSMSSACFGMVLLRLCEGFTNTTEFLMTIDESSFRVCPYDPGHATVFGFCQNFAPDPQYGMDMMYCPRVQLRRVEELARDKAGVEYLIGFESEFVLLKETSPAPVPVGNAGLDYAISGRLPPGSPEAKVLQEIVDALEAAGIEVQKYHAEAAPGQFEMITGPLPPLQAADALVCTRETIIGVAARHGLRATFAPKISMYTAGTAAHTHMSVHELRPAPRTPRADDKLAPHMSAAERSFLQGIVTNIPALCALTLPTMFSYGRVKDGAWTGGTYAAWGRENRETPIRVCGPPGHYHFEARFVDATACPHLVLAAILGAGTQGIIDGVILTSGNCTKAVANMTEEERASLGLQTTGRLGPTLAHARDHLKENKMLRSLFSDDFVDRYCSVNEKLEEVFVAETEEATLTKVVTYW